LKTGSFCNGRIRCSFHGACFNVETGDIEDYPGGDSLPSYLVTLENDDVVVSAPSTLLSTSKVTKIMKKRDLKNEELYVIVGGGCTGSTCAEVLRQEGFTGRIVMINREKHNPYDRTKLSKNMNVPIEKIYLRQNSFYEEYGIEILNGVEVTDLDPNTKKITLSDGQSLTYDKCLVSTGGDPQRLKFITGYNAKNIYPLRTVEDAHNIFSLVEQKDVLIVGSSFIGMETASCIVGMAKSVTVIGMEVVPFQRVLGLEVGTILQKFHENNGVKFVMEAVVQEFVQQDEKCFKVILKDGKGEINCDLVILGAGVVPATGFVKELKKERDQSIVVDEYLHTGKDGLYCGGDIAKYPWKHLPGLLIRIEHWGMAQIHGQVVARNMIRGNVQKCENIPFFWTTQYTKILKYAGHALEYQSIVFDNCGEEISFENPKFVAYYINKGFAIAICAMNLDPICSQFAELLNAGVIISEEQLRESLEKTNSTHSLIKSLISDQHK